MSVKVQANRKLVGLNKDPSWSYQITLGTRSPIVLLSGQAHRFASEDAATTAGRRAVRRFLKEVKGYEDKKSPRSSGIRSYS